MAVETTIFSNNSVDTWFRDIMSDCVLCPRACHVNRLVGQTGYCGQTAELMAARASLHYWEEPCISGTSGSGTVFFSGCNLRCVFCQNHNIALGKAGRVIAPEHLAEIFLQLQEQGPIISTSSPRLIFCRRSLLHWSRQNSRGCIFPLYTIPAAMNLRRHCAIWKGWWIFIFRI